MFRLFCFSIIFILSLKPLSSAENTLDVDSNVSEDHDTKQYYVDSVVKEVLNAFERVNHWEGHKEGSKKEMIDACTNKNEMFVQAYKELLSLDFKPKSLAERSYITYICTLSYNKYILNEEKREIFQKRMLEKSKQNELYQKKLYMVTTLNKSLKKVALQSWCHRFFGVFDFFSNSTRKAKAVCFKRRWKIYSEMALAEFLSQDSLYDKDELKEFGKNHLSANEEVLREAILQISFFQYHFSQF